jgi:predicted ABC-type ATPase
VPWWKTRHLLHTVSSELVDEPSQPTIYILAGPNGAGKTTFANSVLQTFANSREFLNADLIAAGLAPFAPETQAARASELLLKRIIAW